MPPRLGNSRPAANMGRALKGHHWLTAVGPFHGSRGRAADRCAKCGFFRTQSGGELQYWKPAPRRQQPEFIGAVAPVCVPVPPPQLERRP